MTSGFHISIPREYMRTDARADVETYIRSLDVADGWKRAAYLQWLLQTDTPYLPADLDRVVTSRRPTSSAATGLR